MTKDELAEVLRKHRAWLTDEEGGSRADLRGAYLSGAYLSGSASQGGLVWHLFDMGELWL